jgi:acetylornithine deacetylase/succinyl-diaminopimelate desuccinylase-like protein
MTPWNDLLRALGDTPRENGTPALGAAADFLVRTLEGAGLAPRLVAFTAHPERLRIAGAIALLGALLYAWLVRTRRPVAALAVALALPALLLLELDFYVPVFGWLRAAEQHHVEVRIPAAERAQRRLLLTAHYDTKTDLLDHVERAPVELLGLPVAFLMIGGAVVQWRRGWARSRVATVAAFAAAAYGVAMFASLSAGAFVRERSKGALDDGGACAVLVRLAERLAERPPRRTDVDVVLLSAEEIGVQGSWIYAVDRFRQPPDLPTAVVNLEGIGSAPDLGVFGREQFSLRRYEPAPNLVALLDRVHRELRGKPLYVTWYGAGTDARSFLAHDIPAATLLSDLPGHPLPRHLHSAADDRSRVDEIHLDAVLEYLNRVVSEVDARGLAG